MATYTLQTPSAPKFLSQNVLSSGTFWQTVGGITREYDKDLKFIEDNCKVPSEILISIMMATAYSVPALPRPASNAGLMGWDIFYGAPFDKDKRYNAKVVLDYEKVSGRMTKNEEDKLKSFGVTWNKVGNTSSFSEITPQLQTNKKFNLFYAAILLGQLMDGKGVVVDQFPNWSVDNNLKLHLERILVVFLNGANTSKESVKLALSRSTSSALELMNAISTNDPFSAGVINKVLGSGGYLDQIVNTFPSSGLSYAATKFKYA